MSARLEAELPISDRGTSNSEGEVIEGTTLNFLPREGEEQISLKFGLTDIIEPGSSKKQVARV